MYCDAKLSASTLYNKLKTGFRETRFISQQEFEATEVEIPEEIQRLSATVMLSTTVKPASKSRLFNLEDVTEMAKTAAAKFGKTLSFKTRYHNGGHGRASTVARWEVEYDSVKDACDIILNTNNVFGSYNPQAQAEVSLHQTTCPFAELD